MHATKGNVQTSNSQYICRGPWFSHALHSSADHRPIINPKQQRTHYQRMWPDVEILPSQNAHLHIHP